MLIALLYAEAVGAIAYYVGNGCDLDGWRRLLAAVGWLPFLLSGKLA